MKWQDFEDECTTYLNRRFKEYATFYQRGGSNSNESDIEVITKSQKSFFIESKFCPAQCGQFVLLPNVIKRSFEYSHLNFTKLNCYSLAIIQYMNEHFDEYLNAGTAGKDINMKNGSDIFSAWIVQAYKDKGAEFIITNGNVILPIDDLKKCFNVCARYRVKRSGSQNVGWSRIEAVSRYLKENYELKSIKANGEKLFVESERFIHGARFVLDGYEYMISKRGERYELRRLSNTFNANVIFSIDLKYGASGLSDDEFISFLH